MALFYPLLNPLLCSLLSALLTDYTQLYPAIHNYTQLYTTIHDYTRLYTAIPLVRIITICHAAQRSVSVLPATLTEGSAFNLTSGPRISRY